jgi:hypothetical protein
MNKFLFNKTRFLNLICSIFFLLLGMNASWGQVQTLGSFPYMDGGFEGQTATSSIGGTLSTSAWTLQTTTGVVAKSLINDATNSRSGRFYANWTPDAINKRLQTPTTATAANAPQAGTQYTVQYYYKGTTDPTAGIQGGIYATSADSKTSAAANTYSSGVWTKAVASITPTVAPTASLNFAAVRNFPAATNYSFDDFVVYAGAVDNTAPSAASLPTAAIASATTFNIGWTASADSDKTGYMVVRYTANPSSNALAVPNVNGIYAVGNTISNGGLTGTVAYIGNTAATSFVDTVSSTSTQFYYRIFTCLLYTSDAADEMD